MLPNFSPFILIFIILVTIVIGTAIVIVGPFCKTGDIQYLLARIYSRMILFVSRVKVQVKGIENIGEKVSYIVMSNHVSNYDPIIVAGYLPIQLRFAYKKELRWFPIFGWALVAARMIMIDRQNRQLAIRQLDDAAVRILDGSRSIIIFAEGTRSHDGKLKPLKKGGFHLAFNNKVSILPVTIKGSYEILAKGKLKVFPGTVELFIDKPVYPSDNDDIEVIMEKVRNIMEKNLRGEDGV